MSKPGGTSEVKVATPEVQKICDKVRPGVEQKIGKHLKEFVAKTFISQVVAGTNYFVKISIGCGSFVHIRVFQDLQGAVSLRAVQEKKTEADKLEYF